MNAPVDPAMLAKVSLDDKYTLDKGRVFLTGTQALIRLLLLQRERDLRAGLNTAGFVSGYRGSPLGGLDQALWRAQKHLASHHVKFQPGVNEDLAATSIWGSQQLNMFSGAKYDGVYGMWYGKGPGVDRCGDVFKHANSAGTSKHGGVLVLAGDDHAAKSSTEQRNAAIDRARYPWVFALDADERFTPALRDEVARTVAAPRHEAYRVRRRNVYLGRELTRGRWGHDWVTRLFRRERRFVARRVHEHLERVGDVGELEGALLHEPYRDLAHQLEKMNRYARWSAEDLYERGRRATVWSLTGRPAGRFLRAYLLQGAIADGRAGLVGSLLGGCTSFLKYAHLWALEASRRETPPRADADR